MAATLKKPDPKPRPELMPLFTMVVASELTGVGAVMIREYEKCGLIKPRRVHGKRRFSQCDVANISLIKSYTQDQHMTLPGLKMLFRMAPCYKVRACETTTCPLHGKGGLVPCWEVSEGARACRNDYCESCPVYLAGHEKPASKPATKPAARTPKRP